MSSTPSSSNLLLMTGTAVTASLVTVFFQKLLQKRRQSRRKAPKRCAGAIKLKANQYGVYTQLHDYPWEEVLDRMYRSNIRNFTIYYHEETGTMFHHFDWVGGLELSNAKEIETAFAADMNAVAQDPATREWWGYCEPCQDPFSQWPKNLEPHSQQPKGKPPNGDWWAPLICVNHCGYWPIQYSSQKRDPHFVPQNRQKLRSSRKNPPKVI